MSWGTALQAALAAVGGGASSYAQQRERDEERRYRQEMDAANLMRQGFTTPEQLARTREAAGPDVAKYAMQSVGSMLSPGAPPPDASLLQRVLDTAGGSFREGQRITVGGRELVLPESQPQREERLEALQRGERRGEIAAATLREERQRAQDLELRARERQEDLARRERERREDAEREDLRDRRTLGAAQSREMEARERAAAAELTRARTQLVTDVAGGQRTRTAEEMAEIENDIRAYYGLPSRRPAEVSSRSAAPAGGSLVPPPVNPFVLDVRPGEDLLSAARGQARRAAEQPAQDRIFSAAGSAFGRSDAMPSLSPVIVRQMMEQVQRANPQYDGESKEAYAARLKSIMTSMGG